MAVLFKIVDTLRLNFTLFFRIFIGHIIWIQHYRADWLCCSAQIIINYNKALRNSGRFDHIAFAADPLLLRKFHPFARSLVLGFSFLNTAASLAVSMTT